MASSPVQQPAGPFCQDALLEAVTFALWRALHSRAALRHSQTVNRLGSFANRQTNPASFEAQFLLAASDAREKLKRWPAPPPTKSGSWGALISRGASTDVIPFDHRLTAGLEVLLKAWEKLKGLRAFGQPQKFGWQPSSTSRRPKFGENP